MLELDLRVTGGLLPDRTFALLVDDAESERRVGRGGDRIEREGGLFRARVSDAYRELVERFPERVVALDGARPVDEVARAVRENLGAHV